MSNRDPLYGKSDESGSDDLGFDSTLSGTSDDRGNVSGAGSDDLGFDSTLSGTADDRGSFGSGAEESLYDTASGSIGDSNTTEQWNEFYDSTTADDSTLSGGSGNQGSFGGGSQASLYDSGETLRGGESDATEQWNEFYEATTTDDVSGMTGSTGTSGSEGSSGMMDTVTQKAQGTMESAKGMMDTGMSKAGEVAGMAQEKMGGGMTKAGETMDNAAQTLREKGEQQGGPVGTVVSTAAGAMESAGSFMKDANTSEMMDQVETYIRNNPTQSLLIAAGIGFVLAKAFK